VRHLEAVFSDEPGVECLAAREEVPLRSSSGLTDAADICEYTLTYG
jgi:hypothetical protein